MNKLKTNSAIQNSNTTLVKVKLMNKLKTNSAIQNSNTTLVKVKC